MGAGHSDACLEQKFGKVFLNTAGVAALEMRERVWAQAPQSRQSIYGCTVRLAIGDGSLASSVGQRRDNARSETHRLERIQGRKAAKASDLATRIRYSTTFHPSC